jgi:hypothetical protein
MQRVFHATQLDRLKEDAKSCVSHHTVRQNTQKKDKRPTHRHHTITAGSWQSVPPPHRIWQLANMEEEYEWATAEGSVDTFALRQDTTSGGTCGWDAGCKSLINLGKLSKGSTYKDYRNRLGAFVRKCESKHFVWEGWNAPYSLEELRKKVSWYGKIKKQHWYAVEDFMLTCGCFQVPIFIYHDWTNRRGEVKKMGVEDISSELISDGKTTEIFIPQGDGRALGIRRPGFVLPFQRKCVCIFYKSHHFTWLKVRPENNKWSADEKAKKVRILLFFKIQTYWLMILLILARRMQH